MQRRTLGRLGRDVSRLGIGLAAVGRPGYINLGRATDLGDPAARSVDALRARAFEVLDAALAVGATYVDVARSYGFAEAFLADWLAERGDAAAGVVVGSKWGYAYTADWRIDADAHEVKEHSLERLDRQWSESTAALGARLDLYQIHSATQESGVLRNETVLTRLAALRDQGVAIGLSVSGPKQADTIRQALRIESDGAPLFAVVQATWNLFERSAGPALAEAHDAGCGVIVKEALANGRLTAHNRSDPRLAALSHDVAPDAVAIAAVLAQPWADVVLSGAATPAHLRANAAALDRTDGAAWLDRVAAEPSDQYWAARAKLAWA